MCGPHPAFWADQSMVFCIYAAAEAWQIYTAACVRHLPACKKGVPVRVKVLPYLTSVNLHSSVQGKDSGLTCKADASLSGGLKDAGIVPRVCNTWHTRP